MYEIQPAELAYHKIAAIRTLKVRSRFPRLNGKNAVRCEHAYGEEFVVKELITNQGATGWGLFPGNFWDQDKSLDQVLLGKSIDQMFSIERGVIDPAAMPFDFALHDLAGVVLNTSVSQLLGGAGENPIECYDGAILMDDISPDSAPGGLSAVLEECRADWALGYRAFKLKIGRGAKWMEQKAGIARDIAVTRLVRAQFPECTLMVDANSMYTPETLEQYIDGVYDCGLHWIEEPCWENREDFLKIRAYLKQKSPCTLLADGENKPELPLLLALAKEGLLDVMQMDIAGFGFTNWREIMPKVRESGVLASPHNWGLKIKTHYTAALGAGVPGLGMVEGVLDETEGVDFSGYVLSGGKLIVPDAPGFGMKLIWGMKL